ncbi:MAG: hypothetical protein ACE5JG_11245 [Planctomycetota bacterium]
MSAVLNWIKVNLATVTCVIVMIAAPVAFWIVSGRMNAAVQEEVKARAAKLAELGRFEKTSITFDYPVPGSRPVKASVAVNRRFLERYEEVVGRVRQDIDQVRAEVLRINRKERGVLVPELFPEPPMERRETLPQDMYLALRKAYRKLLEEVGAGAPPSVQEMLDDLNAARERYLTQILKRSTDTLSEEEQQWLTEQLTKARLSYYADAARGLSLYASLESLDVPQESDVPARAEGEAMTRMFDWQWQFWIKQDILRALAEANASYGSVAEAPVKRVVSLVVLDEPGAGSSGSAVAGGASGPAGGFGPASSGRRRGGSSPARGGSGGRKVARVDPSREVPLDFAVSFTGRRTNPLYDVRRAELVLVADSARIPEIFDALAGQNFMTVLNARVESLDLFESIRDGYFYGAAPVSRLTLELETIWIREWTTAFMPPELKQALGIPAESRSTG